MNRLYWFLIIPGIIFSKEFWEGAESLQSDQGYQQKKKKKKKKPNRKVLLWNGLSVLLLTRENPHSSTAGWTPTDRPAFDEYFLAELLSPTFPLARVTQPLWPPRYYLNVQWTLLGCFVCLGLCFPDSITANALASLKRPALTLLWKS